MSQTTTTDPLQPGLPLPPGQTLDLTGPFTLQPYHALTAVGCIILTTIAVAARMYTKAFIIKKIVWEDITCVIAWVAFMAFIGIEYSIGTHGGGTHQWNVLYRDVQYNWRYSNYGDIVYSLALLFTKLSILMLILRVFCSVQKNAGYWCTLSLIWLNTIFYTVYFFIPIFSCTPRPKIWAPDTPGSCMEINILYYASAIFNVVSDILMLTVPIFLIWNLQMSIRRKVGVSAIFLTGALACVSSILRLIYISFLTRTQDYTYTKITSVMWSESELCFALLCGCFPVMPRLYQHLTTAAGSGGARYANSAGGGGGGGGWRSNTYGGNTYGYTGGSEAWENRQKGSNSGTGSGVGGGGGGRMWSPTRKGHWKDQKEGGEGGVPLSPLALNAPSRAVLSHEELSRDEEALEEGVQGKGDVEMGWGRM